MLKAEVSSPVLKRDQSSSLGKPTDALLKSPSSFDLLAPLNIKEVAAPSVEKNAPPSCWRRFLSTLCCQRKQMGEYEPLPEEARQFHL